MINLNIPENMRRFRKLRSRWSDTSKETLFEVMERKRCENCLGRLIDTQRKGMDTCKCDKDKYKETMIGVEESTLECDERDMGIVKNRKLRTSD